MKMFHFGRNWKNYVKNVVDEMAIQGAKQSLLKYLNEDIYKKSTFLDIGFGSGLFSLSALLLGCKRVVSFDIDEESLETFKILVHKFQRYLPEDFEERLIYFKGNILDENITKELMHSPFDIVYSWGVLHHTGQMWKAIENASKLVKNNGFFIIAIYNHAQTSHYWYNIKKFYNDYKIFQPLMEFLYASYVALRFMIRRRTFKLRKEREMHIWYDAIDWVGGYPYEYACFDEIKEFVENLGFELIKAPTKLSCGKGVKPKFWEIFRTANTGCNEFVFRKV